MKTQGIDRLSRYAKSPLTDTQLDAWCDDIRQSIRQCEQVNSLAGIMTIMQWVGEVKERDFLTGQWFTDTIKLAHDAAYNIANNLAQGAKGEW